MNPENKADGAFTFLFSDLVARIMSLADDPARCVAFIAEELRSIVGARTIALLECVHLTGHGSHRLVSLIPERRRELFDDPHIEQLATLSHDYRGTCLVAPGDGSPGGALLAELGIGDSIIMPLRYASRGVGSIFFLDLLDRSNIGSILECFEQLSPILAIVLRNAYLYENLEAEVEKRTAELEAKSLALAASLREKETLLREIHHRVKNNLQIVNSLLWLRMSGIRDEETRALFVESQNRVLAMALVHEELYSAADLARVDMADYVPRLVERLVASSSVPIALSYEIDAAWLGPDDAIPCGLILDELVMNALKYAYLGRAQGKLSIRIVSSGEDFLLEVSDDGPGLVPEAIAGSKSGLGLSIVRSLVEQLDGALEIDTGKGARFSLSFKRHGA